MFSIVSNRQSFPFAVHQLLVSLHFYYINTHLGPSRYLRLRSSKSLKRSFFNHPCKQKNMEYKNSQNQFVTKESRFTWRSSPNANRYVVFPMNIIYKYCDYFFPSCNDKIAYLKIEGHVISFPW